MTRKDKQRIKEDLQSTPAVPNKLREMKLKSAAYDDVRHYISSTLENNPENALLKHVLDVMDKSLELQKLTEEEQK